VLFASRAPAALRVLLRLARPPSSFPAVSSFPAGSSCRAVSSCQSVLLGLCSGSGPPGSVACAAARCRAAGGRGAAGGGVFVPHSAERVQAVTLGLAGRGVGGERVQGVPVEGGLCRTVGPLDRAERALDPRRGH